MALNIKNAEAYRLARELAEETGESLTVAVKTALEERLIAVRRAKEPSAPLAEISRIQDFVAALPDVDPRSPEEIIGYDQYGLPS